jgi:hypothetical protein
MISRNFKMAEFSVSDTARRAGIPNDIPQEVRPAIQALVLNLLQPVCDLKNWHGQILSGYRSPALNALVGGAASSQHTKGEAADVVFYTKPSGDVLPVAPLAVLRGIQGMEFDQAIAYNGFVHLSYTAGRPNRRQVLYDKSYKGERL